MAWREACTRLQAARADFVRDTTRKAGSHEADARWAQRQYSTIWASLGPQTIRAPAADEKSQAQADDADADSLAQRPAKFLARCAELLFETLRSATGLDPMGQRQVQDCAKLLKRCVETATNRVLVVGLKEQVNELETEMKEIEEDFMDNFNLLLKMVSIFNKNLTSSYLY